MSLFRSFLTAGSFAIRSAPLQSQKLSGPIQIVGLTTTLTLSHFYSTSSILYAESNSKSSSILREASPAALRKPSSQIVFLSRFEDRRKDWGNWLGYFREAGYDCFDMNIATVDKESGVDELTEELTQQLRLLSLQRPPLVFAFHSKGSEEALHQVQSKDPRISGLVILVPSSDKKSLEELSGLNLDRLRILVVDESQEKGAAFQQVERWMASQGLA